MTSTAALPTATTVGVTQLAHLLTELSQVQTELLDLLRDKQQRLALREPEEINALAEREAELAARLQTCHDRRHALLAQAQEEGLPSDSIASLAGTLPDGQRGPLARQIKESAARMRILQHQSLANWVLAQRALLHVAQLLEIVATGGRMQPTYGNASQSVARGNLLNSEA
jgi:flagellar biosynthesis/type III secretory pathway chaperone